MWDRKRGVDRSMTTLGYKDTKQTWSRHEADMKQISQNQWTSLTHLREKSRLVEESAMDNLGAVLRVAASSHLGAAKMSCLRGIGNQGWGQLQWDISLHFCSWHLGYVCSAREREETSAETAIQVPQCPRFRGLRNPANVYCDLK